MASAEAEDLPRTNVRRIIRNKLAECSGRKDVQVNKDALLAFSESAKIFIHYLSAAANEVCHENKRQTISAADVLTAVKELDFPEFSAPLQTTLDLYREENKTKKSESKARSGGRKRKAEAGGEAATEEDRERQGQDEGPERGQEEEEEPALGDKQGMFDEGGPTSQVEEWIGTGQDGEGAGLTSMEDTEADAGQGKEALASEEAEVGGGEAHLTAV